MLLKYHAKINLGLLTCIRETISCNNRNYRKNEAHITISYHFRLSQTIVTKYKNQDQISKPNQADGINLIVS